MDNHVDPHFFVTKFYPISFIQEECNVYPFLPEYTEQMNIPICTVITDLAHDYREVIILYF